MKKVLAILILCAAVCAPLAAQEEYTLVYRGDVQGTVTIRRDRGGKITITQKLTQVSGIVWLDNALCPLIPVLPKWLDIPTNRISINATVSSIVIEGGTRTTTYPGGSGSKLVIQGNTAMESRLNSSWWQKTVVEGTTITVTISNGMWNKTVVEGNTTTQTWSSGSWNATIVEGNTITVTTSDGDRYTEVVNGNTTTITDKSGYWEKWVHEGGTTTGTWSDGRWEKTVVEREGNIIFITKQSGKK
jgi:hypothetical protein